jgi:large subunit ribosomal protein L35
MEDGMPKMKTAKGAAKRFRMTARRKIKRARSFANHILTKKSRGRKRNLRKPALIADADYDRIRRLLPYA